nr:hypothetical protein [uncultured Albidiferax sp.]
MTPVILQFKGLASLKGPAMERLRQQLPGVVLTPKTSTLVEALVNDSQVPRLMTSTDWDVTLPSYAEVSPPSFDLFRFRDEQDS